MATTGPTSLAFTNSSDANFRAWANFIDDTFTNAGWVQTSDTGQINLTTVTAPVAINTKAGYQVWRMADSLQSTKPVYVRIDYGSGPSAASNPGIWITIGTGSDGSGNITGVLFNGTSTSTATLPGTANASAVNMFGSGGTGRMCVMLNHSGTNFVGFGIERTKDSAGADDSTGLLFMCFKNGSTAFQFPAGWSTAFSFTNGHHMFYHYMPFSGTQPPTTAGLAYILFNANPSVFGSDVGFGVPVPMGTVAKQPGTQWAVCRTSDILNEATAAVTIYGASVTYVRLTTQPQVMNSGSATSDTTAAIMMRFD